MKLIARRTALFAVFSVSVLLGGVPSYAAFDSASLKQNQPLEVLRVTPEGEDVPVGRQIVIQFNRDVVPVGEMGRDSKDIPVKIEPALQCEWRWLSSSALSCNLDEKNALQEATTYRVTIGTDAFSEDGAKLDLTSAHSFTTERPDVRYAWFRQWLSPSTPKIRLTFNQAVTQSSVEQSIYFQQADQHSGKVYALKVEPDLEDRKLPDFLLLPNTKTWIRLEEQEPQKSDDDARKLQGEEARRVWLVTPKEALPQDAAMSLRVKAGLVSALGEGRGIADREVSRFQTFPAFSFLGVRCYTNANDRDAVLITQDLKQAKVLCNPMRSVSLSFSSPVLRSVVKKHIRFTPALNVNAENTDIWGNDADGSQLASAYEAGKTYEIFLPAGIKAASSYHVQSQEVSHNILVRFWRWLKALFVDVPPEGLVDEFGRALTLPISLSFETDHRKPNFEIVHNEAVIERATDSEVPLYVNNLTKTLFNYRRLTADGAQDALTFVQKLPKVQDIQYAIPFGVREMLQGKSGAVFGHLATEPLVSKYAGAHRLFAQVTPYQVHAKLGHFASHIWVMDMHTGQPVAGARVSIYKDKLSALSVVKKPLSQALTADDGVAALDGLHTLDPHLELIHRWKDDDERLFVRVDKDGEMALLPISQDFEIDSYRSVGESVYAHSQERYGHIKTWGTTAQGIYRVGDTVQYKIYVRNQDNQRFTPAPKGVYHLEILDQTDNVVHEVSDITLNEFGAYAGEFPVSKEAAVGWYQFRLRSDFATQRSYESESEPVVWLPLRVLVSDFTPSPFKVTNDLNGDLFQSGQSIEVDTQATMHAGGAYTDANVRVTGMLQSLTFHSEHPVAKNFTFGSYIGTSEQVQVFQKMERVDDNGAHKARVTIPPQAIFYGRLMVESSVQDDRGKYVSAQSYANYAGVDRYVGLRLDDWMLEVGKAKPVRYIVVDEKGQPAAGTSVHLSFERQETKSARVKGAGNAYTTEFTNQWVAAGGCDGVSTTADMSCDFIPKTAGYYRVIASIKDTHQRVHSTELNVYAIGGGYVAWNATDDNALEIIPEKPTYKVGDKARYMIKNPYPEAQALVTIERYGVLHHFVQTLTGSTPVIEFEVKPDYIPGYYLSVVVFSPRVDKPIKDQVDLGKPTFRIGYVSVPIRDVTKEMDVKATTDKPVYKPREKVTLSLHAQPRLAQSSPESIEMAVAVVDESVFDLIAGGKAYFDPYQGLYALDGLDVRNYSLLTRLVGRQKFEKKGANQGGDGGSDLAMRNLFKFVSYWNPSIKADAQGNAMVSFDVPDNLTGWRVLAMAVTPSDRFGLGDVNFKVNKPTEIRPVMPNQASEGDRFEAGFSVMNRSDKKRDIVVNIRAEGDVNAQGAPITLNRVVTLEPYKRETVYVHVATSMLDMSRERAQGAVTFHITAEDTLDGDALEHRVVVHKRRSLETAANYGTTTQAQVSENVRVPDTVIPDVGEVSVELAPSVIGNIAGAFAYVRDYPYFCWEQQLAKAVMAAHFIQLQAYLPKDTVWKEAEQLPQQTLEGASGFQAPNGGMAYFIPQDQYVDPYLSAYTALAFNWLKKAGYDIPQEVESKLHGYLSNVLKQDAYPDFYSKGMAATVRAVALAALSEHGLVSAQDIERYRSHVPQMSLFGKTFFAQAAMHVPHSEAVVTEVLKSILAHASQSGGKFSFNEELDDSYSRMLSTPLRENCTILSLTTQLGEQDATKALVEDIPFKLTRMITQARGSRTHWENTQENVFCMQGLIDFARVYEQVKPAMTVNAQVDAQAIGQASFSDVKDRQVILQKPLQAADVGKTLHVSLSREGEGRLYYATKLRYATRADASKPVNAGIEVHREYSVERDGKWQLLQSPLQLKPAELVRVDVFLSLPTARQFVVVDDPVAGGLEPVNRDLATASVVDADKAKFQAAGGSWWFTYNDWVSYNVSRWSFYHQELRHDAVRFYADYLPAGNYHLSYTAQVIATGEFAIQPTHVQEMYDADVYGKGVAQNLRVQAVQ